MIMKYYKFSINGQPVIIEAASLKEAKVKANSISGKVAPLGLWKPTDVMHKIIK